MGVVGGGGHRRRACIDDDRGAPGRKPGIAHRQSLGRARLDLARRQRVVEPSVRAASSAVEPGEAAIGMAERTQRRRDAGDGIEVCARHAPVDLAQGGGGPGEKREDLEQFLGVAGGQPALVVDLLVALMRQRPHCGVGEVFLALKRKARVDQAGQRLEPRQSGNGGAPAAGQEPCLRGQRAEKGAAFLAALPAQEEDGVVDPANDAPPGQVRGPAGALPGAVALDPAPDPGLCLGSRGGVAHGRQIVEPGKSVTLSIEGWAGGGDLPQPGLGAVHEEAREENVARDQLAALGETAHRAGFRLRHEPLGRGLVPAQPRMQLVHEPGAAPGNTFRGKHRLCLARSQALLGG